MTTRVSKRGHSLAVRIPMVEKDGAVVIRPARRKYRLEQLVSRITARNRHGETDWGSPRGKEVW